MSKFVTTIQNPFRFSSQECISWCVILNFAMWGFVQARGDPIFDAAINIMVVLNWNTECLIEYKMFVLTTSFALKIKSCFCPELAYGNDNAFLLTRVIVPIYLRFQTIITCRKFSQLWDMLTSRPFSILRIVIRAVPIFDREQTMTFPKLAARIVVMITQLLLEISTVLHFPNPFDESITSWDWSVTYAALHWIFCVVCIYSMIVKCTILDSKDWWYFCHCTLSW